MTYLFSGLVGFGWLISWTFLKIILIMLFIPQSSAPVELTEAETEYAVNVVKHVYDGHIVFQYNCTNTIPEQLLEDVRALKP